MCAPELRARSHLFGGNVATIRHHTRIARSVDDVWAVVSDFGGIGAWFPGVESCSFDGTDRTVGTMGIEIVERLGVNDPDLHRLQYSIVGGAMTPEHHLATIDVIEDGDGALVIYSCDLLPDEAKELIDPVYAGAAEALRNHLEG